MDMKCIEEGQMQQFIDNECSRKEVEIIERHIKQCHTCAQRVMKKREISANVKRSIDLMITHQPNMPEFEPLARVTQNKLSVRKFLLPLIAAASLLLMIIINPFDKTNNKQPTGLHLESYISEGFDANKPVTDYPLIMTVITPDGIVSQTIIN
jgi:hypothetical protein